MSKCQAPSPIIGVVGYGNMGASLAKSLSANFKVYIFDTDKKKLKKSKNIFICSSIKHLILKSEYIILAIKPNIIEDVCFQIKDYLSNNKVLISIAAGKKIKSIIKAANFKKVVRVMPNTGCLVNQGYCAVCFTPQIASKDKKIILSLFAASGKAITLKEKHFDAFTALAGSGPAYVFYFIESLTEAGIKLGFSYKQSLEISLQLMKAGVSLINKTKLSAKDLRLMVTSPNGTTEAAVKVLETNKVKSIFKNALLQAKKRSKELSK